MFKKAHWFNSKPKNPLSLDHLRYLCNVMSKNSVVTEQNKTLLVETLRQIAEILIWGDQNDSTVFDFFLERNMLSLFLDIMKQKCGNYVTVQLLQTLNILFENIRHETSLYYLLSNNHVNSIITHKFDLSDEEVMAYYISFLKTLSFKLNPHTIHFFFNTSEFPLYTEAIKYFNHPEKMVRIAVRILTLNVFKVDEKSMLKFITGQTVPCLSDLVHFIKDNVMNIEKRLKESSSQSSPSITPPATETSNISTNSSNLQLQIQQSAHRQKMTSTNISPRNSIAKPLEFLNKDSESHANLDIISKGNQSNTTNNFNAEKLLFKLDDLFAEQLDHLHYLNDIMMLRIDDINRVLTEHLMHHLIKPLVDAYKDDPRSSMIRLFSLEFATSILSKVLNTSLYEDDSPDYDDEGENNISNVSEEKRDRLAKDVKDCNDKRDLTEVKLSSAQLAIIEQSKEIAEIKVKSLLKTDAQRQMTYLSLFDTEYNDMRRKRLSTDYLLLDSPLAIQASQFKLDSIKSKQGNIVGKTDANKLNSASLSPQAQVSVNQKENATNSGFEDGGGPATAINTMSTTAPSETKLEIDRARYQIRDFLLWRQLLLNIRNEKDRELSLKNTSWLSYAKLLQWLE